MKLSLIELQLIPQSQGFSPSLVYSCSFRFFFSSPHQRYRHNNHHCQCVQQKLASAPLPTNSIPCVPLSVLAPPFLSAQVRWWWSTTHACSPERFCSVLYFIIFQACLLRQGLSKGRRREGGEARQVASGWLSFPSGSLSFDQENCLVYPKDCCSERQA